MDMRAVLRDALMRVGGPTHDGNFFPGFYGLPRLQIFPNGVQVSVERIDFDAIDEMAKHDIISVVRKGAATVDVGDRAIGGRHHGVRWFALVVALDAPDVQPPMYL